MILRALSLLVAATILIGCPGDSSPIDAFESANAAASESICRCWEALGFEAPAICLSMRDQYSPLEARCLAEVLERHPEAEENIFCSTNAFWEAESCMRAVPSSCPEERVRECVESLQKTANSCPSVPASVRPEFMMCVE